MSLTRHQITATALRRASTATATSRSRRLMLAPRLITAAIGIPIIVGVIYVGGVLFTAVICVILAIAAIEFVHMMMRVEQLLWRPHPDAIAAAVGCAALPI